MVHARFAIRKHRTSSILYINHLLLLYIPSHFAAWPAETCRRSLAGSAARQRLEEQPPILFGEYAAIQDGDHASIGGCADQTPKSLAEFQDGFGEIILLEGIFVHFGARRDKRIGGDIEGKFCQHDNR